MPNNVYVGSRYVPLFAGAWDNSVTYEPLTIVEYGNNSYTSKKPVLAGTLPTDTDYWALTGNYNGQISNLQNQIGDLTSLDTTDQTSLVNAINEVFGVCKGVTLAQFTTDGVTTYGAFLDNMYSQVQSIINSMDYYAKRRLIFDGPYGCYPIRDIGSNTLEFYGIYNIKDDRSTKDIFAFKLAINNLSEVFREHTTYVNYAPDSVYVERWTNAVPAAGQLFKMILV